MIIPKSNFWELAIIQNSDYTNFVESFNVFHSELGDLDLCTKWLPAGI
jgi:hypothetical protein